ncbi:MAG: hypothetical protein WAU86_04435 [Oricola sp.]
MAVQEALIVLSLLGCDDTGTQCEYLKASDQRFETIQACSAASDAFLETSRDAEYPAVVAVCAPRVEVADRPAQPAAPAEAVADAAANTASGGVAVDASAADVAETDYLAHVASTIAAMAPRRETITKPIGQAADETMRLGNAAIVGVRRMAKAVNPF